MKNIEAKEPDRPAMSAETPTTPTTPATTVHLKDEPVEALAKVASDLGIDPKDFPDKAALVSAILDRRSLIGVLDREALVEIVRWGGRDVPATATKEALAHEAVQIKSMRFGNLSLRALVVLAKLRGLDVAPDATRDDVLGLLKSKEGFWQKLNRKRRAFVGNMVSKMIGGDLLGTQTPDVDTSAPAAGSATPSRASTSRASASSERPIEHEIEEAGLLAGLTSRVKRTADQYLNQKLDEIEARIDRKLDEIDRKLGQWRDKEIANRIRILKISLWATIAIGGATLLISWLSVYVPMLWN